MPLRRVLLLALLSIAEAMPAQQIDSATRAEREGWRIILLDSLAKGRQRWKRAALDSYVIQSHVGCFCIWGPDEPLPKALVTIRHGRIVARAAAIGGEYAAKPFWTVDSLFDHVERDLRGGMEADVAAIAGRPSIAQDFVRKATRLELHPVFGFPIAYSAETPEIPDIWTDIRVDTFAVLPRSTVKRP